MEYHEGKKNIRNTDRKTGKNIQEDKGSGED